MLECIQVNKNKTMKNNFENLTTIFDESQTIEDYQIDYEGLESDERSQASNHTDQDVGRTALSEFVKSDFALAA